MACIILCRFFGDNGCQFIRFWFYRRGKIAVVNEFDEKVFFGSVFPFENETVGNEFTDFLVAFIERGRRVLAQVCG
jgi:hypothetical protein